MFVEYERFGLDLRRKDSFPLMDPYVQNDYLEAAARTGMEITGIYLYLLNHQSFMKAEDGTPQADQCYETIEKAILAASQMGIPMVTVPMNGMFGIGQHTYAYRKLEYAVKKGEEYGVQIAASTDTGLDRQIEVVDSFEGKLKLDFCTTDPIVNAREDAPDFIRGLGKDRIAHFRVKDLKVDSEGFITAETSKPALLGAGDADFMMAAEAIRETGYEGWIISETSYYAQCVNRTIPADYVGSAAWDMDTLRSVFGQETI